MVHQFPSEICDRRFLKRKVFPFIDFVSVLQKHQWPEKSYSTFDVVETFVQYDVTNFPTHRYTPIEDSLIIQS